MFFILPSSLCVLHVSVHVSILAFLSVFPEFYKLLMCLNVRVAIKKEQKAEQFSPVQQRSMSHCLLILEQK